MAAGWCTTSVCKPATPLTPLPHTTHPASAMYKFRVSVPSPPFLGLLTRGVVLCQSCRDDETAVAFKPERLTLQIPGQVVGGQPPPFSSAAPQPAAWPAPP